MLRTDGKMDGQRENSKPPPKTLFNGGGGGGGGGGEVLLCKVSYSQLSSMQ